MASVSNVPTQTGSATVTVFERSILPLSVEDAGKIYRALCREIFPEEVPSEYISEWDILFPEFFQADALILMKFGGDFKSALVRLETGILTMLSDEHAEYKRKQLEAAELRANELPTKNTASELQYAKHLVAAPKSFLQAVQAISPDLHDVLLNMVGSSNQ
jgi:hypothetical protein